MKLCVLCGSGFSRHRVSQRQRAKRHILPPAAN